MMVESENFEQCILKIPDCFVFKVPPLRSASGHRAEDWELEKPLFTGYLKIYQADIQLFVRIYKFKGAYTRTPDDSQLQFFAECPVEIKPKETITNFIDSVIDSSRYFVLKIKDRKSNKTAIIGIGWQDRDPAFDFKNCLNEYIRYVDRSRRAENHEGDANEEVEEHNNEDDEDNDVHVEGYEKAQSSSTSKNSTATTTTSHLNLGLEPGKKITIKSIGSKKSHTPSSSSVSNDVSTSFEHVASIITSSSSSSSSSGTTISTQSNSNNNSSPITAVSRLSFILPPPPTNGSLSPKSTSPIATPTPTNSIQSIATDQATTTTTTIVSDIGDASVDTKTIGLRSKSTDVDIDDWGDFESATIQ